MFIPDQYLFSLTQLLKTAFNERLVYIGLQGSYLRGEATETSDIDIMVVIRDMTVKDLDAYRQAITALDGFEKSCGFICGQEELQHWNPLEICHLLHTTKDYLGSLASLVPAYAESDLLNYTKLSLGNMYHELCHRYIHAPMEDSIAALPGTYKAVFYILQNLHYLRSGHFIASKSDMLAALSGQDRLVLEKAVSLKNAAGCDFDEDFSLLFTWCRDTLNQLA